MPKKVITSHLMTCPGFSREGKRVDTKNPVNVIVTVFEDGSTSVSCPWRTQGVLSPIYYCNPYCHRKLKEGTALAKTCPIEKNSEKSHSNSLFKGCFFNLHTCNFYTIIYQECSHTSKPIMKIKPIRKDSKFQIASPKLK